MEIDKGALERRYVFPPFSVLNVNGGAWRTRKAMWLDCGLNSVEGRDSDMIFGAKRNNKNLAIKAQKEKELGRGITWDEFAEYFPDAEEAEGTSIFDPNIVDILVNWFCPAGGTVIDPFAGGSVRGTVTSLLGRKYIGVDLSARQIDANIKQWGAVRDKVDWNGESPAWHNDDGHNLADYVKGSANFILSCPPYHDLEVYSDAPGDLSNMEYDDFLVAYRAIIRRAVEKLEEDSFAAFVVGEIRHGKNGAYRNFVGDTVSAFVDAGTDYYNELILYTPLGSLPIRVGAQFEATRKIGKTHQNILVFVKGDARKAASKCVGAVKNFFTGNEVPALDDLFV